MKKILLFSVVLVLAGTSTMAQDKTHLKKGKFPLATTSQAVSTKTPSDLEKRMAEKQLDIQRRNATGTDTRFSKGSALKAAPVKKN